VFTGSPLSSLRDAAAPTHRGLEVVEAVEAAVRHPKHVPRPQRRHPRLGRPQHGEAPPHLGLRRVGGPHGGVGSPRPAVDAVEVGHGVNGDLMGKHVGVFTGKV
jgi:hypothetical protein